MAAILKFKMAAIPQTKHIIIKFLAPQNVGVAAKIAHLCVLDAEILAI